jgi:hypothetical protein
MELIGWYGLMAGTLRIQYPVVFYHVTCRGNEGKGIFVDHEDRMVFLKKPAVSSDESINPKSARWWAVLTTVRSGSQQPFAKTVG